MRMSHTRHKLVSTVRTQAPTRRLSVALGSKNKKGYAIARVNIQEEYNKLTDYTMQNIEDKIPTRLYCTKCHSPLYSVRNRMYVKIAGDALLILST